MKASAPLELSRLWCITDQRLGRKGAEYVIIGCDYHPSFQQIAFVDRETGECGERKLTHKEEAESFYRDLNGRSVRGGMEATGHARWFERLQAEQNIERWIGDPAEIRANRGRTQENDHREAVQHMQFR